MSEPAHVHQTHHEIVKRPGRADGHLKGTIEMIEAGRACLHGARRLRAFEKAIGQAKRTWLQDHLDHCLDDVVGPLPRGRRTATEVSNEIAKCV